ncbi:uncharacterized protein LOC110451897 [Mizuhopecten yessoensis]|uniref:uncharacterized protein LOC110451897 n=1 Tax=Mizuhopecten yessoensis TaxID=6573 RepID=UPI000B458316|nr:uncharacterized protein LOC110451897 [Mizuhopecten yessoensis]
MPFSLKAVFGVRPFVLSLGLCFMSCVFICLADPARLGDLCDSDTKCRSAVDHSVCGFNRKCICERRRYPENNGTLCHEMPRLLGHRCAEDANCIDIPNARCSENNTCICTYKYKDTDDRTACSARPRVSIPTVTDLWLGRICNLEDKEPCPNWNITNQRCMSEDGRVNTRCRCVAGFSNVYNEGECQGCRFCKQSTL